MLFRFLWMLCLIAFMGCLGCTHKKETPQEVKNKLLKAIKQIKQNGNIKVIKLEPYLDYDKFSVDLLVFQEFDVGYGLAYEYINPGVRYVSAWAVCGYEDKDVDLPVKLAKICGNCLGDYRKKLSGDRSTIYFIYRKSNYTCLITATCRNCDDVTKAPKFKEFLLIMKDISDQVTK